MNGPVDGWSLSALTIQYGSSMDRLRLGKPEHHRVRYGVIYVDLGMSAARPITG
jgi:hypothetical protein